MNLAPLRGCLTEQGDGIRKEIPEEICGLLVHHTHAQHVQTKLSTRLNTFPVKPGLSNLTGHESKLCADSKGGSERCLYTVGPAVPGSTRVFTAFPTLYVTAKPLPTISHPSPLTAEATLPDWLP